MGLAPSLEYLENSVSSIVSKQLYKMRAATKPAPKPKLRRPLAKLAGSGWKLQSCNKAITASQIPGRTGSMTAGEL
jgi:hypothetical protein